VCSGDGKVIFGWTGAVFFRLHFRLHFRRRGELHDLFAEIKEQNDQMKQPLEVIEKEIWGPCAYLESVDEMNTLEPEVQS
jgi:hypothetical protein